MEGRMHSSERSGQAPGPQGDAGHHPKDSVANRTRSNKSRGSISSGASRKESQQKREELYRKWEEFKAIQEEEKHAYLEQKIELQRELIRAHDQHFTSQRLEADRRLQELRKSELQKKKATEEALTQKCKEELGREKEEHLTKKAQERAAERKRQKDEREQLEGGGGDGSGVPAPSAAGRRGLSTIPSRAETGLSGEVTFEPHDATGVLMEEGEDAIPREETFDEMPLHKQRLYNLFGEEEAEYFLHPRIEPERRKVIRVPHAVKQLGGRAGADTLWDTLRDRSQVKLQYADSRIPLELKDAYGAFVRECLTKNKTVAKRSFYSETEVPDNEKLQDSSYKERVKEAQRRMELMYRAALANEDKTGVLLYNNPMPDFNNFEGHEGPLRYLPSWLHVEDDEEEGTVGDASYKRWLPSSSQADMECLPFQDNFESYDIDMVKEANHHDNRESDMQSYNDMDYDVERHTSDRSVSSLSLPDMALGAEEENVYARPPPLPHPSDTENVGDASARALEDGNLGGTRTQKKKKLIFLTEKDAMCEGRFLENIAAKEKKDELVTGADVEAAAAETPREGQRSSRRGKQKLRSHTAPASFGKAQSSSDPSPGGGTATTPRGDKVSERRSRHTRSSKDPDWEPLTMTALNDHKPAIQLFGGADFAHGREFMWKPVLSTTTNTTTKGS